MKCEYCPREFPDNMDGLATKTFHEILKHADIISPRKKIIFSGIPSEDANTWNRSYKNKKDGNHGRYGIDESY